MPHSSIQYNKEQNISFGTCRIAGALCEHFNKASFFIASNTKEETRRLKTEHQKPSCIQTIIIQPQTLQK